MLNVKTLTDTMSRMQLPQLQQYAALHKNDPYIVTLALSIANQKKQMQAGQAGQAGMMPQPKVVDQDIAQMVPAAPQQALPEESGIGQLPAQNMQNMAGGGIVAFDDGGEVPGYASGGQPSAKQIFAEKYHDAAVRAGEQLGVDPGIIISQWGLETGWGKSIIPGTNNLGNIKDFSGKGTSAYDKAEKSTSKYRKYETPEAFADDYVKLIKRKFPEAVGAGNDVNKFTAGLRPGEKGGYASDENYATKLAKTFTNFLPFGTASAEEVRPSTPSVADQIPGQSVKAPAAKQEDTSFFSPGWFEQKAEDLGLSKDVGRNVFNTFMAPTPLAPATTLPSKGLGIAGLGEKIYNKLVPAAGMSEKQVAALRAENEAARLAEAAKGSQLPQRITGPAQALEQGSQVIPVTSAGQATVQSAADLEKARLANQAADQLAATQAAQRAAQAAEKIPSAAERLQQASYIRESDEAARLMNQARAAANIKTGLQTAEGIAALPESAEAPFVANKTANAYDTGVMGGAPLPTAEEGIVAALKDKKAPAELAVEPEAAKKPSFDFNDFLIHSGLALAANKDPNALAAIGASGQAGLAALDAKQKMLADLEARTNEAEYRKAMGIEAKAKAKQAEAMAGAIERGAKEKNLQLEAEKLIAQELSKDKFLNMPGQEAARAAREAQMRATIYRQLGIEPTMGTGAPAPTGGFSVVGSRPG